MDIKGVCYDVGRVYPGDFLTRRVFDPAATRRELQDSVFMGEGPHPNLEWAWPAPMTCVQRLPRQLGWVRPSALRYVCGLPARSHWLTRLFR
jgi:hypothetical protein